jgi:hypothetical protein
MRHLTAIALLGLLSAAAHALPSDVKVLAQFDLGFARCEARFPHMRGHRDEAYLGLYKAKVDDKARAELAQARKSGPYKAAREAALKTQDKSASPALEEKLKLQCQATWAEAQRNSTPVLKP